MGYQQVINRPSNGPIWRYPHKGMGVFFRHYTGRFSNIGAYRLRPDGCDVSHTHRQYPYRIRPHGKPYIAQHRVEN